VRSAKKQDGDWDEYQTPAAKAEYGRRLREFAMLMGDQGDLISAEFNVYLAELYERNNDVSTAA